MKKRKTAKAVKQQTVSYKKKSKTKKKNWIQGAIKHPGALHRDLGVKSGQKIPTGKLAAAANRGGKVGQRARLAETLEGMHKKKAAKKQAWMKKVGGKPC